MARTYRKPNGRPYWHHRARTYQKGRRRRVRAPWKEWSL